MFQVAAAFYFVFVGWQLTTKAIKLQKMAFDAVFEKTKQILAVLFFLLAVRLLLRIFRLETESILLRFIFTCIYAFYFLCAVMMVLRSKAYINKVKKIDNVLLLVQNFNNMVLVVFSLFFLWAVAYIVRQVLRFLRR